MKKLGQITDWLGTYLLNFTQTQLAVTLVSLPILVSWGLGFSVMTFIGNLIFAPVLMIFLILSSLLLFTELIGVPNYILATLLNGLTSAWDGILAQGSNNWVLEFAKPHTAALVCTPIIAFLLLQHRLINSVIKRIALMVALIALFWGLCWLQKKENAQGPLVRQFHEKLYSIKLVNSSSLILIDDGFFVRKKSPDKSVDFELKPWIVKHHGNVRIAELRLLNPCRGSFLAAQHICTLWPVEAIWLPYFKKELSKSGWRAYFDLKRLAEEKGIRLVRRGYEEH